MAKNLQGLALAHSEKGDYEVAKPLVSEAGYLVQKYAFISKVELSEKIRLIIAKSECLKHRLKPISVNLTQQVSS